MFSPIRLWYAVTRDKDLGLLVGLLVVAFLFSATPFLIPAVSDEFDITLGAAGVYATVQVGGFALAAFFAGRRLATSRAILIGAVIGATLANVLSALAAELWPLLVFRFVAGVSAGLITWLAWAKGMRTAGATRKVSAAGPLGALAGAPVAAWLVGQFGLETMFWVLAVAHVPIAFLPASFAGYRIERRVMSPSQSNVVLLLAVGLMVLAASALFVQAASVGERVIGLNPIVVALAFSANALAGLIAASRSAPDTVAAWPVVGIAVCAGLVAWSGNGYVWFAALSAWGMFFWLTVPRVLRAVASWSLVPEERVGDAQSVLAVGRAFGPALGGVVLGADRFGALGSFSVIGVVMAAVMVEGVRRYRVANTPPSGAVGA